MDSMDIEVLLRRLRLFLTMVCPIPLDVKKMQALNLAYILQQLVEHDDIAAFFEAKRFGDVNWQPRGRWMR